MRSMMLATHLQHITLGIQAAVSSSATSSDVSERLDAATFCSRWATRTVPGMGRMTGLRCRSHASATCPAVAPRAFATRSTRPPGGSARPSARVPSLSNAHGS